VSRRVKFRWLVLGLLLWQVGLAVVSPMSTLHAHEMPHASDAAVAASDAGLGDCHGEGSSAAEEHEPAPADAPPCCQSHTCHGDCIVMPAMPNHLAIIGVLIRTQQSIPVLRTGLISPPMPEFFRPPI
jgi:hypothetical protein